MTDFADARRRLPEQRVRDLAGHGHDARPDRVRRAARRPVRRLPSASATRTPRLARPLRGRRADGISRRRRDRPRSWPSPCCAAASSMPTGDAWKRDPTIYSGPILNGLFYLFLNRLRPTADLVDAAVARLEQVPRGAGAGRANLDPTLAQPAHRGARHRRRPRPAPATCAACSRRRRDTTRSATACVAAGAIAGDASRRLRRAPRGCSPSRPAGRGSLRRGALQPPAAGARAPRFRRPLAARHGPGRVRPAGR